MFGNENPSAWIGFLIFVLILIFIDLGVFSKKSRIISIKEAAIMSAGWIGVALIFNLFVYFWLGKTPAIEFFTGWLLEKSLSVDNLFVFLVIFNYFKVAPQYQRHVLLWGILGALIMRATFIIVGTNLVAVTHIQVGGLQLNPLLLLFGVFLIYTGYKLTVEQEEEDPQLEDNVVVRIARRYLPIADKYNEDKFTIIQNGKRLFTPLIVGLLVIETTDLIFAVDSIPAIIGVTQDPFIVFTSNIMAILGLRALYFLLASVLDKFYYLKYALAAILSFVGLKMVTEDLLLEPLLHLSKETLAMITLGFVLVALTVGIVASLRHSPQADLQPKS